VLEINDVFHLDVPALPPKNKSILHAAERNGKRGALHRYIHTQSKFTYEITFSFSFLVLLWLQPS
jgi:hypothetical protein